MARQFHTRSTAIPQSLFFSIRQLNTELIEPVFAHFSLLLMVTLQHDFYDTLTPQFGSKLAWGEPGVSIRAGQRIRS